MNTLRLLKGFSGVVRVAQHQGREHLVVPVVALIGNSVIHAVNAPTAELVPLATLEDGPERWNDKPICLGHPVRGGRQCSANDPEIMASYAFGHIREAQIKDGKLSCEAWLDSDRLTSLGATATLEKLRAGQMMDVSVGAFVRTTDEAGDWYGKKYSAKWAQIVPDHLAFLPHTSGACSIKMGCGANRAAEGFEALSNPEGINQYTGGGVGSPKEAKAATKEADKVSALANARDKATPQQKADLHSDAAVAQGKAAEAHVAASKGAKTAATKDYHNTMAAHHRSRAEDHTRAAGAYATIEAAEGAPMTWKEKILATLAGLVEDVKKASEPEVITPEPTTLEQSLDERIGAVNSAVGAKFNRSSSLMLEPNPSVYAFAHRVFEDHVIISKGDKYFSCDYTVGDDGTVEIAEPTEVKLEFVAAAGARNSASDQKRIQTMHDYSVELGATCSAQNIKALEEPVSEVEIVNTETAIDGGKEEAMDPKKAALIKALTECPCSGFTTEDVKTLEAFSEERLTALAAVGKARKATEDELTAATKRIATIEGELKAAQAAIIPADELATLKTLAAEKAAADEAHKATIVTALKTAQSEYTEDELKAMDIKSLERLSKVVKIPDFSGRGMPRAAETSDHKYAPPDAYADGLKALAVKSN